MGAFQRLVFRLPEESEELLAAELWALGTLGVEVGVAAEGELEAVAWFDGGAAPSLAGCERLGARLVARDRPEPRDWLAEYRRRARPFELGKRLLIDPGETGGAAVATAAGRRRLELPARTAFGTGTHESTRLAIALLEDEELDGRRVLDVGTGSGVLALAARLWGATAVVGLEIDPVAALIAGQNRRRNALDVWLFAGGSDALAAPARFDLLVANMTLGSHRRALPLAAAHLCRGGVALLSGFLVDQEPELPGLLEPLRLEEAGRRRDGEWCALKAVRR